MLHIIIIYLWTNFLSAKYAIPSAISAAIWYSSISVGGESGHSSSASWKCHWNSFKRIHRWWLANREWWNCVSKLWLTQFSSPFAILTKILQVCGSTDIDKIVSKWLIPIFWKTVLVTVENEIPSLSYRNVHPVAHSDHTIITDILPLHFYDIIIV
mgnify:CR=1 FL=1